MRQRPLSHFARLSIALTALAVIAVGCGSGDSTTADAAGASPTVTSADAMASTDAMADGTKAPHDSMADGTMADGTKAPNDAMAEGATAPWQKMEITDVAGATFRLSDFAGRPVFVENFATWCPTCRKQLGDTQKAAAQIGERAVVIALSVETDLSADDVADYAKSNGFENIRFAVMSKELLAAMVDAFGNSAVNPPSTPHVIIDAAGVAGEMTTGRISATDLVAALDAAA